MQKYQIGVDVGGTKTRVGIVDHKYHLVSCSQCEQEISFTYCGVRTMATKAYGFIVFPTPTLQRYPSYSVEKLQNMLVSYISQAIKALHTDIPSVEMNSGAVSFAGLVKENAVITKAADLYFEWGEWDEAGMSSTIPSGEGFFLKQALEEKNPQMTWFLVNDVIAAAYRYRQLPRYQHIQNLVLLTISTGVGYTFFNQSTDVLGDGDLVSLGHRVVDTSSNALDCDCGGKGHLAAYFSGKAVERRVRERAAHDLQGFVQSSLCCSLRERFSSMSLEEKKEQVQSAANSLIWKNVSLADGEITAFLQRPQISSSEFYGNMNEAFLLAMMTTNREIVMSINNNDAFVIACMNEMMETFALGFQEILDQDPEKIIIMGGFVLSIKKVFLEMLIAHMSKGGKYQEMQTCLQKRIEWAFEDDLDGVIGSICAKHVFDETLQGKVTQSIIHGSTVFEIQAFTEKRVSYVQTNNIFALQNRRLRNVLTKGSGIASKVLIIGDDHISPELEEKIFDYFNASAISFSLHKVAASTLSMKDVEEILHAAKTFKIGRKDYILTIGCRATLHCGGLAAAIYRRGISHIFIPLDDNGTDAAVSRNTVEMYAWEKSGSVSNHHPPDFVVLDEMLNSHCHQIASEIKTIRQVDHYAVVFVNDLFHPQNTTLFSYISGHSAFVVLSEAADVIFGEKIRNYLQVNNVEYRSYVYSGGENKKYWMHVLEIVREILMGQDANEILICIGGGTTMDLAGFAAALTDRQYIRVPTTLLGVIDAGIGVKVGCNYQGSKNFLGDFYAPLVCLNDTAFLQTVSPRNMRAGLAEILKMGIIRAPRIIKIIEDYHSRLISERLQIGRYARILLEQATYWMLQELQTNLHENRTLKRLVDFGHTFSPYLEIKSDHRILHGEAVAIDMAICAQIAFLQGYCTEETQIRIIHVLMAVGLPLFDEACDAEGLFQSLKDIRLARGGSLHLPIPQHLGKMIFIEHLTYEELKQALAYLQKIHRKNQARSLSSQIITQQRDTARQWTLA